LQVLYPENRRKAAGLVLVLFLAMLSAGCGYHVAGRASQLPSEWKTIAVPAFKNDTTQYRIEQRFTQAVIREFISRTKYRVIQDEAAADGVLHGEILTVETSPMLFDSTTGQVTTMLVTVRAKVQLVDNHSKNPVYQNKEMVFRDEYQISSDVQTFFEEQSPAVERMAHDFATKLVSNVMENF
jgi:outer membrane lipopolysaccharide assembly protein LptE/RlpB